MPGPEHVESAPQPTSIAGAQRDAQRNTPNLLLNQRQAAEVLGVCERTVYTLRKSGKLKFVKIGTSVRYSRATLEAWINESESVEASL